MMNQKDLQNQQHIHTQQLTIHTNIARIFNTYGPNMQIDDGRVVTNFIYQAIKQSKI